MNHMMVWIFGMMVVMGAACPASAATQETKTAAKEVKAKAAKAAPAAAAPAAQVPAAPSKEELMQRSLTGLENQRSWVATLQKQLDGEKAKLVQIEADHNKLYPSSAKKS